MKNFSRQTGYILIQTLVFAVVAVLILGGIVSWANVNIKSARTVVAREQAFQIAEAGLDYYRWHLAHSSTDYYDGHGSSTPGPYIHEYFDRSGNLVGHFTLTITPPPTGSTLVTVVSKGTVLSEPSVQRTLEAKLAILSWAKYSVAANDEMRFGEGTEIFGPIHSNQGVRFDGLAHNIITSSVATYNDPDHSASGGNQEFGVHTHKNIPPQTGINQDFRLLEAPTNPVMARTDVFEAGRQFPVPAIDFTGLTVDLATLRDKANNGGRYIASSAAQGYHLILKTNDTFDLYKVTAQTDKPHRCSGPSGDQSWDTWSIKTEEFVANYPIPTNSVIYVEDNVWVDGQINTAFVTIAAGRLPDNPAHRKHIIVNNDLLYTNYDGGDVIGLIAQGNFNVGLVSEDDLRIDAALIAQNGRVGRHYYDDDCGASYLRETLTLFGMLGTNERYGFAYVNSSGERISGYNIRNIVYDANLLYGPPPSFPLTTDQYQVVSWREVK